MTDTPKDEIKDAIPAALLPAAREFGEKFAAAGGDLGQTAVGLVHVASAPLRALIWGFEQVEARLIPRIVELIEAIPMERRTPPKMSIVGPALEASKFSLDDDNLREMFAQLGASAVDSERSGATHPSFAGFIGQMTGREAESMTQLYRRYAPPKSYPSPFFPVLTLSNTGEKGDYVYARDFSFMNIASALTHLNLTISETASFFDNAVRLGLVRTSYDGICSDREADVYHQLLYCPAVVNFCKLIEEDGRKSTARREYGYFTSLGLKFYESVAPRVDT